MSGGLKASAQWLDVSKDVIPPVNWAFDHQHLLSLALERLHNKAAYSTLPFGLMPELFTLTELQQVFEMVLMQPLQKKAFRRRVQDAGVVVATEISKISGKRPAQLFRVANNVHHIFSRAIMTDGVR